MLFDLKHLAAFVAVAEELNFHRAADRLVMAQPAVSRLIQELESRLGIRLLERTTRRVRLTEPGRFFLHEARDILERIELAQNTSRLLATGTKASLRIGYTTITGHSLVPDITRDFRHDNPDVRLDLTYLSSPAQRDQILQDEIDIGFLVGAFKNSEIESKLIARHSIVALLPPGHHLASRDALSVKDLAGEALVLGTDSEWPTFRRIVTKMFQNEGQVLKIGQEATSLIGILGLITAGMGITVFCGLPRFCGRDVIVERPIRTSSPTIVETHIAWKRSRVSSTIERFVQTSQDVGKRYIEGS